MLISVGIKQKIVVFLNPNAGRGARGKLVDTLVESLRSEGFEVFSTDLIEQLQSYAGEHRQTLTAIVSAGGDGTAETVVNATAEEGAPPIPVAVFPLGTENLLAKYLGIRADPALLTQLIGASHTRQLDAGRANGKVFLLMLSCGFDAEVVRRLHQDRQGNISHLAYAMPMLDSIRNYDYPNLRVEWEAEGEWQQRDCHWAFCFNAPTYAAGLRIVPNADPSDGSLDLATFGGGSFWHGLRQFSAVVLGQHFQMPDFHHDVCRRIRITSSAEGVPYQIDGDPGGILPVELEIVPDHLTVIANSAAE